MKQKSDNTSNIIMLWGILLFCYACNQQPSSASVKPGIIAQLDTAQYTTINWKDTLINFGSVNEGDTIQVSFGFINSGNKPLFINDVRPSCGCTIADYPQRAIAPGDSGVIAASFRTGWHPGSQVKLIIVKTNTKPKTNSKLVLRGEVIPKPKK